MRKKLLPIVIVAIVAAAVVVTGILLHWGGPSTPSTLTILSMTEGNVSVMKAGTNSWVEAQVGMSLESRDTIKSGDDSGARITFFDGSTIELEAGTQIEIVSLGISDTGSTTIKLKQTIGDTISRVTKLVNSASSYEVETPACVASVRGSSMLVQVIADGTSWVTNQEGDIWVIANGVELQIPEGRKCIITPGQSPQLVPLDDGGTGGGGGGGEGLLPPPDIAITKMPDLTQAHEGDVVTYTYTVTNPGHVPLSHVSVTDDRIEVVTYQSGDSDHDGRLDDNETWIFTASYTVTTDDVSPLVNTAAAAGTFATRTIIAWATASVEILPPAIAPAIALTKTAEPVEAHVGDNITYTYTVTNAGDTPLSDISIIDDKIEGITQFSGDTNENEILDLGETWVFTATYTIPAEPENPLVNHATVYGTYAPEQTVTAQATASVDILRPAIAVNKAAEPVEAHVGDNITYTYTVTNAGNMPLSDISIIDDKIEGITQFSGDTNENEILDLGETWIFTATYTIPAEPENPLVNHATVYGTYAPGQTVTAQATASVDILQPAIAINKTAEPVEAYVGDNITYTYTITNTGNTPLSDISVTDDKIGDITYDGGYQSGDTNGDEILDLDETWIFTATYNVASNDTSPLVNTATVSGTDALCRSAKSEEAIASVDILRLVVVRFPDAGTAYIGYEDQFHGDFDYNDFGMQMFIEEVYVDDCLTETNMQFESVIKQSSGVHDIHILRTLSASTSYNYTITRSTPAQGTETSAVPNASGQDDFNIILFDTSHFTSGDTVTIHIEITGGCEPYNSTPVPPRGDLASIWAYYDPYMYYRTTPTSTRHIGDWQSAASPLPTQGYNVPYILVIPVTDWEAPGEGTCITNLYPYFDNYYATGLPEDWYEIKAPD